MELSLIERNILKFKFIPQIGNKTIINIIERYKSINRELTFNDCKKFLDKDQQDNFLKINDEDFEKLFQKLFENFKKNSISCITLFDQNYPKPLKEIFNPPVIIFIKGNIDFIYDQSIAVVGTRTFTEYGKILCEKFVTSFSENKFTIVSGLAYGIDSVALATGIKMGTKTIGVIGSGFDFIYPASNKRLYENIIQSGGGIITEYLPWERPHPGFFPARNRIIAGLSKSTLVIEAAIKSGSLITAQFAFENGRDVYAIPADLTREHSQGCNEIIRRNIAKLVIDPSNILLDYGFQTAEQKAENNMFEYVADPEHRELLLLIQNQPLTTNEILEKTEFSIQKLNSILSELEILSLVQKGIDDKWKVK